MKFGKSIAELYPPIYSEAEVPAYRLSKIGSPAQTRALFREHMYGHLPIETPERRINVFDREDQAIGGTARRWQLRVFLRTSIGQFEFTVLVYLPVSVSSPSPLVLGLNFMGNHTVHADPSIALPTSWSPPGEKGEGTWATEKKRGSRAHRWPLETLLKRGYGLGAIYCGDFAPDHPGHVGEGILRLLPRPASEISDETRGGAIAAWAWGLSRALDALATLPEIDVNRVALIGHSRLGKAALWAGACDKRLSLVISNNSGAGEQLFSGGESEND